METKAELEDFAKLFKEVESAKKEWEHTMDCVDAIIVLVNPTGAIKRCNKALKDFVQKPFSEILGSSLEDCLVEMNAGSIDLAEKHAEIFCGKTGQWFAVNCYPYFSDTNEMGAGIVVTMNDISLLKQLSEDLLEINKTLRATQTQMLQQEKMASVGQLAAGVAHEINNPMGFVTSNLGVAKRYIVRFAEFIDLQSRALEKAGLAEEINTTRRKLKIDFMLDDIGELLKESLEGAARVKDIVKNLKSFSHVDKAESVATNINEGIDATLNVIWNELKYKTTVHKKYGKLPLLVCNPQELNQVFMNILINAAQAIHEKGDIIISTGVENNWIKIVITDTGQGIPADKLEHIFEPFFTTKDVGKGTGLGLSICYDLVKKHNGSISVDSEVGRGTSFTIYLPLQEV